MSRNDIDRVARFPKISAAVKALKSHTLLLDGEAIVVDRKGVSHFQLLQQGKIKDAIYAVFDCLFRDGKDLRKQALSDRRGGDGRGPSDSGKILIPSHRLAANGLEALQGGAEERLRRTSLLRIWILAIRRIAFSQYWLKVKVHQEDEFVIGGFTSPAGSRKLFWSVVAGSFLVAAELSFRREGGHGLTTKRLLSALFQETAVPLVRTKPAFVDPPRAKGVHVRRAQTGGANFLPGNHRGQKSFASRFT